MIEQLIAEATECDFKVALEIKKPKSWLKSVSSFSNGIGGTMFFGISLAAKSILICLMIGWKSHLLAVCLAAAQFRNTIFTVFVPCDETL